MSFFNKMVLLIIYAKSLWSRIQGHSKSLLQIVLVKTLFWLLRELYMGSHVNFFQVGSFIKEVTAAKLLQSCPTLCNPIDGSPPGSPIPRILQTRTLEWVAISFSNAWKWKVKGKSLSRVRLFATPWTAAHQAPLSMGFSRQQYWSGVPLPSPKE